MRKYFIIIICFICFSVNAQKPATNYNTQIDKAQKVEINDGVITIKKADSVIIKIYVTPNLKTKLYLSSIFQIKDTMTGDFISTIKLTNPNLIEYNDIKITLRFDKEVKDVHTESGMAFSMITEMRNDKKQWDLKIGKCFCENGLILKIYSKEKIVVSLFGIEGNI